MIRINPATILEDLDVFKDCSRGAKLCLALVIHPLHLSSTLTYISRPPPCMNACMIILLSGCLYRYPQREQKRPALLNLNFYVPICLKLLIQVKAKIVLKYFINKINKYYLLIFLYGYKVPKASRFVMKTKYQAIHAVSAQLSVMPRM